jgi:hypothetical protein
MGGRKNASTLLVGKLVGKRPLKAPRYRLVDKIKTDLGEILKRFLTKMICHTGLPAERCRITITNEDCPGIRICVPSSDFQFLYALIPGLCYK